LAHTLPKYGVKTIFVDPDRPEDFDAAVTERTKAIFVEVIGNPSANVVDVDAVARVAEAHGIPLIVDNTLATPYLFKPFEHGAHVVVHSATKYIGGHGNSIGGLIIDGGNFNWASGKFPGFTTPDPAYGGMVHWDRWGNYPGIGNFAFVMKARLQYLRDMGACRRSMPSCCSWAWRHCRSASNGRCNRRSAWRNSWRCIPMSPG
jgi:O-acetylhomoserine (thiol)-lyase